MQNLTTREEFEVLASHLKDSVNRGTLELMRNSFAATAGLTSGILVALTQVGTEQSSLKLAVFCSSVAAPIGLLLALVVELYLHLGEESYGDFNILRSTKIFMSLQRLAVLSMYVAVTSVVFYLWVWAVIPFILSTVVGVGYLLYCYARVAKRLATNES